MKLSLFVMLLMDLPMLSFSQSIVDWTPDYHLTLSDFQSPQTEISDQLSSYSLFSGADLGFSFHMSTYEFMFTKNFNSKVSCTFNKEAAIITAPDSAIAQQLVSFGQFSFDLTELFARRFRQELHEQKGTFSSISFFQPIYDKLQTEMNAINARMLKQTGLGKDEVLLREEHEKVLLQIESLSGYCKDCKLPKRRKKKK